MSPEVQRSGTRPVEAVGAINIWMRTRHGAYTRIDPDAGSTSTTV
ncbi:hypothetical protein M2272_002685 [Mycobacterium frederiksbergense]|uniref:Uncharacterized protein n=1 Tax=Mycolicibacterium frederiksbergense TaxID=117567 RepID=A0ABT6L191_9MYCO|nr:hypothetical protein [Mycolicibacterium frederiksbergense]MDH6196045.1 hypothetical protein [Mycolicibacterium frederiksbergense]